MILRRAFSVIELVIVVVIIAALVAIAVPRLSSASSDATINALAQDFRLLEQALRYYHADHGGWPPNQPVGVYPPELEGYYAESLFLRGPSIDRRWDWNPTFGLFVPNIAIQYPGADLELMRRFDERYDDGDLGTGNFRRHTAQWFMWRVMP